MAFIGKTFFEYGEGGSPEDFTRMCAVYSISGLGKTKSLVDVTTFCSGGNREYIGGLADGQEMTIEANFEGIDTNEAAMIANLDDDTNHNYRIVIEYGSPTKYLLFSGTPLSWVLTPSVDGKNSITFTIKISGDITIA